ncbi:MAG: hypothetical protein HUJ73_04140 [Eubacterium sp.]|nr:hypothetical protein [Eubacterium sp.]
MDIKNSPDRYAETIGLPAFDLSKVRESKDFLLSGKVDYEFRTTVVREFHDAASFEEIGSFIRGAEKYFLQTFVDREKVLYGGLSAYGADEMEKFKDQLTSYVKHVEIRG